MRVISVLVSPSAICLSLLVQIFQQGTVIATVQGRKRHWELPPPERQRRLNLFPLHRVREILPSVGDQMP